MLQFVGSVYIRQKETQFINYLTILNHENRRLIFGPICPKSFEDVQFGQVFVK